MKKLSTLLLAIFAFVASQQLNATTLTVTSNSSSGIDNTNYTGTLSDGSVLGFYKDSYDSYAYFCGAIASATSIDVPDSISISGTKYVVQCFGLGINYNIDFDEATSVTSLTLPSTITNIINTIPSQISDLHLKSTTPPWLNSSRSIASGTTIWVPQDAYSNYTSYTNSSNSYWYQKVVHYEGWQPKAVTVTVNTPGTFAQLLLSQVSQWSDVDELTVIGKLNDTDLAYLSRLKYVTKIDLSQADIKSINGCAALTMLKTIILPSTVTVVAENAFKNCSALSGINLQNVTEISSSAFYYCSSLTSVTLSAATTIGDGAFSDCWSLTSVTLPVTLQSLGNRAFSGCSKLADVYCYVVSPLTTTAFSNTGASTTTLHVPTFSVNAYILHDNWYTFNKIVALDGNIDKVSIVSDFTITELTGLADKVDLSVASKYYYYAGHLTVSAGSKWTLGNYYQSQANRYSSSWNSDNTQTYTYYNSTLIPSSEMSAVNVTVSYSAVPDQWNFISFPFDVNVSDITYPKGTLWVIRKYSGDDRAKMTGNTWQNMTDGMTLKAGEGYILHCTKSESSSSNYYSNYIEFVFKAIDNAKKNNIFAYQDVTKSLSTFASDLAHNRNWNLVGNPYPCFYNTKSIEHNGVITVWNGNGYTAYSLLDDDYQLRPNEAFFVQCPDGATSMKFKAEGRTHEYTGTSSSTNYAKAMSSFASTSVTDRSVYNMTLTGNDYTDKARVVINSNAKLDYEISCDASKFMSTNSVVPQLYVLENGQEMSIDERPLADGSVALGMYIGEAGDYTIAMSTTQAGDVILTDNVEGKTVNLSNESYTFSASKGTSDSRFTLKIGGATAIKNVNADVNVDTDAEIYNIGGQKLAAPQQGVNIINGKKVIYKSNSLID